jgi:D-glycero-alpha-D-manno-heptose-7-phosphate kinase
LRLTDSMRHALQRRMALIYLGRAHRSSAMHEMVIRDCERLGPDHPQLMTLRAAALRARDAIIAGDFTALAAAMRQNTEAQAALHRDLVHGDAWRVIDTAERHGAIGWKVNGAGGDGGSITVLCGDVSGGRRAIISAVLRENPACSAIPIALADEGLRVSGPR